MYVKMSSGKFRPFYLSVRILLEQTRASRFWIYTHNQIFAKSGDLSFVDEYHNHVLDTNCSELKNS